MELEEKKNSQEYPSPFLPSSARNYSHDFSAREGSRYLGKIGLTPFERDVVTEQTEYYFASLIPSNENVT